MTVLRPDIHRDLELIDSEKETGHRSLAAEQWSYTNSVQVPRATNSSSDAYLPAVSIKSNPAEANQLSAAPEQNEKYSHPIYNNPYQQSLKERVDDLMSTAPSGFNSSGEGTRAIQALASDEVKYPDSEFVDKQGRLSSEAKMSNSTGTLQEGIYASARERTSAIQLGFFAISSSERLDHPGYALEIARHIKMDKDCQRIIELAEDVREPVLRKALKLTAYEAFLNRAGESYFGIAYEEVQKLDFTKNRSAEEFAQLIKEKKNRDSKNEEDLSKLRPGLSEAQEQELSQILPHVASSREFWENVRRTKFDW